MSRHLSAEKQVVDIISQRDKHYYSIEEIREGCPSLSYERIKKALSIAARDDWISVLTPHQDRRKKAYTLKARKDTAIAWVNNSNPYDNSELTNLGGEKGPLHIPHNLGVTIPIVQCPDIDRIAYTKTWQPIKGNLYKQIEITLPFVKENSHHKAKIRNCNNETFVVWFRAFSYRGPERTREVWEKIVRYVEELCNFLETEYGFVVAHPVHHDWEIAIENRYLDDIVDKGYYLIGEDHWVDNTPRTKDNHAKEEIPFNETTLDKAELIAKRIKRQEEQNDDIAEIKQILVQIGRGNMEIANALTLHTAHHIHSQPKQFECGNYYQALNNTDISDDKPPGLKTSFVKNNRTNFSTLENVEWISGRIRTSGKRITRGKARRWAKELMRESRSDDWVDDEFSLLMIDKIERGEKSGKRRKLQL